MEDECYVTLPSDDEGDDRGLETGFGAQLVSPSQVRPRSAISTSRCYDAPKTGLNVRNVARAITAMDVQARPGSHR